MAEDIPIDVLTLPRPPARKSGDYLTAYKGWAYSAVRLVAQTASTVEIKLYKRTQKGDGIEITEVFGHDSSAVLHFVNEFQTGPQLEEISFVYQDLLGEYAWLLLKSGNTIASIIPLRPDWIDVKPDGKGGVSKYIYYPGGSYKPVDLEPDSMLFYKDFDPVNMYRGYGKIKAAAMDIDIDDFSDDWNRNFFFNAALPSMFLSTDSKLSKEAKKRFVEKFQQQFGGRQNAHKIAFMDGGQLKVDQLSAKMQELDFQNSKKRLRDKILAMWHVSKSNIGLTDDVNRANALAQERRFMKVVVKPKLVNYVGFLNEFYLPKWDDTQDMFFNFEDPVPEDVEAKTELYKIASQEGWVTVNEVREELLMKEPLEGGDVIYKPFNLQPVGGDGVVIEEVVENSETDEDIEKEDEKEKSVSLIKRVTRGLFGKKDEKLSGVIKMERKNIKKKPRFNFGAPIPPIDHRRRRLVALHKNIGHDIKTLIVHLMKNGKVGDGKVESFMTSESRDAYWKEFVAKTDVQEQVMAKKVQELAIEQQKHVIDRVEGFESILEGDGGKLKPNSFLFSLRKENVRWKKSMRPFLANIMREQGNGALADLGKKQIKQELDLFDMSTDEMELYLRELGVEFVNEVNGFTREQLIETISEGLRAGEDVKGLISRVTDVYAGLKGYRATRIARTQVLQANNYAAVEAYRQSGVVVSKEWLTAQDERVREDHVAADGQVVKMGKKFSVGGEELRQPGDPSGSAAQVVNCRCTVLPVTVTQSRSLQEAQQKKTDLKIKDVYNNVAQTVLESEHKKQDVKNRKLKDETSKLSEALEKVVVDKVKEVASVVVEEKRKASEKIKSDVNQVELEERTIARHTVDTDKEVMYKLKDLVKGKKLELDTIEVEKAGKELAVEDELQERYEDGIKDIDKKLGKREKELGSAVERGQVALDEKLKEVKADVKTKQKDVQELEDEIQDLEKEEKIQRDKVNTNIESLKARKVVEVDNVVKGKQLEEKKRLELVNNKLSKVRKQVKVKKSEIQDLEKEEKVQKEEISTSVEKLKVKRVKEVERIARKKQLEKEKDLRLVTSKFKKKRMEIKDMEKRIEDLKNGAVGILEKAQRKGKVIIEDAQKKAKRESQLMSDKIKTRLTTLRDKINRPDDG